MIFPRNLLLLAIPLCLLWVVPKASAQANDDTRTILSAALEVIQDLSGTVVRDVADASQQVYDNFFGGDASEAPNLEAAVGVYGVPDVSMTRELLRTGIQAEISTEDLSSNPALLAVVGGESVLQAVLETTIDAPLSPEAQEQMALEARFDRAIQGNLLLSNERANTYERMVPHVQMRADAVGLVELSANIGFARGEVEDD